MLGNQAASTLPSATAKFQRVPMKASSTLSLTRSLRRCIWKEKKEKGSCQLPWLILPSHHPAHEEGTLPRPGQLGTSAPTGQASLISEISLKRDEPHGALLAWAVLPAYLCSTCPGAGVQGCPSRGVFSPSIKPTSGLCRFHGRGGVR